MKSAKPAKEKPKNSVFSLIPRYKGFLVGLLGLAILSNALNLAIPKLVANGIDAFGKGTYDLIGFGLPFLGVMFGVLLAAYALAILQAFTAERVARDIRRDVADKISRQTFSYVQTTTPSKLLTNLTSDVDAVKTFVSMATVTLISSVFLILGACALLLSTNLKLGLAVVLIVPLIGGTFFVVFRRVGPLFKQAQEVVDRLNKTINESILGAALIRVLNAGKEEDVKFAEVNTQAKNVGISILRMFASMIPLITFLASAATLTILGFGGHLVIAGEMTVGQLAAFNSYVAILIFPIIMIGFMSSLIGRAAASYARIAEVLDAPAAAEGGEEIATLRGDIEMKDVSILVGEKAILKDVSFALSAGTRTAIIGPTAAGKTQLLYALTGLITPTKGVVLYDQRPVTVYDPQSLHSQLGLVFQDSIIFNLTLRENISFGQDISPEYFEKAMETAELSDFVHTLPDGLDTLVSERGTSLSGGQKQRLMLARALALNPKILLLDDFTARVDTNTEHRILANVRKNYPNLTLVSVTQKIASVEDYDRIILLMEGEVLAQGTHAELMSRSPEYVQIFESQRSTNRYEHQAD
ncbi:ABC transporter ATP-binding protein/permease [Patescibacteria group bacterium]|nr:ABC transporter ATP-binding protein/permease [Patescibacteria group bacterium]